MRLLLLPALALLLTSCRTLDTPRPGEALWQSIAPLCGRSFEGRMVEGTASSDAAFGAQRLVMHVESCSDRTIRIPFAVGDDRSRTWTLTRNEAGVRLEHDHRHADGTPDRVTGYGGDANADPAALRLDFPADAFTAALLPAARTNIGTIEVRPGATFTYALRREAEGRRFRVDFDLSREVSER
jgi:hypothetical protein